MRVSLSVETPKQADELPGTVVPALVRDKVRKSFAFRCWRWDFTRVHEGVSRSDVEDARRRGLERFEVEVECADFRGYAAERDDEHVAESLVMKLTDLLLGATRVHVVASR